MHIRADQRSCDMPMATPMPGLVVGRRANCYTRPNPPSRHERACGHLSVPTSLRTSLPKDTMASAAVVNRADMHSRRLWIDSHRD